MPTGNLRVFSNPGRRPVGSPVFRSINMKNITVLFLFLPVLLIMALAPSARGFGTGVEGCQGNCAACHSITRDEAQALVGSLDAESTVMEVKPSPVRGLYQATVRRGKEEGILYIDFAKQHLISGILIDAARKKDLTGDELKSRKRIDIGALSLENALILGNPFGAKKIYLFTDPECPYCAELHREVTQLVREDPELAVYIILFPLDSHPGAADKTDRIICASKTSMSQAVAMLEQCFDKKELAAASCGKRYVEHTRRLAADLGIGMTPSIVMSDGRLVLGMRKKDELKKLLADQTTVAPPKREDAPVGNRAPHS
jgi:thiol:disulfide interchange protein DsbC